MEIMDSGLNRVCSVQLALNIAQQIKINNLV